MKACNILVFILAIALIGPVFAEPNETSAVPTVTPSLIPVNVTETETIQPLAPVLPTATETPAAPPENATEISPTPSPVPEPPVIPAPTTIAPVVTTIVPVPEAVVVAATTIPLPPHMQDTGLDIPSDLSIPGMTGYDPNPTDGSRQDAVEGGPETPAAENYRVCMGYTMKCMGRPYNKTPMSPQEMDKWRYIKEPFRVVMTKNKKCCSEILGVFVAGYCAEDYVADWLDCMSLYPKVLIGGDAYQEIYLDYDKRC